MTFSPSDLRVIELMEAEYKREQQRRTREEEAARAAKETQVRAAIRGVLQKKLPELLPFVDMASVRVEHSVITPTAVIVPALIPNHALIHIYMTRHYLPDEEPGYELGSASATKMSRVALSVASGQGSLEFGFPFVLGEVLTRAAAEFEGWQAAQERWRREEEPEGTAAAAPATGTTNFVFDTPGARYEPFWSDGHHAIGYKVTHRNGISEYIYLAANSEAPGDFPNASIYQGPYGNPKEDTRHFVIFSSCIQKLPSL